MNRTLFERYAALKIQEKAIAAELEELNPQIKDQIKAEGADKIESEFGSFSLALRKIWKYSKAVAALQDEEKANGIAEAKEIEYLIFKTNQ